MSELFLVDKLSDSSFSYNDLIRELNSGEVFVPAYVRSSSTYEVFKSYVWALLFETKITLLDNDFSAEEISQLVPETNWAELGTHYRLDTPIRDLDDLTQRLRASGRAEIGFFTSGTTGLPKQVNHRLSSLARSVQFKQEHRNSVWAFAFNPTHIAGCQVFLQAVLNGSCLVNVFGLGRSEILQAIRKHNATHISATPTFYRLLMPVDAPLASVLRVTSGGEKMDVALTQQLERLFPQAKFLNVYASTEAGTILAADGEVFSIKSGLESLVKIEENQLYLHQELLGNFAGQANESMTWYATGDIVEFVSDDPLRFKIVHRANELINVGGYKVNPAEVEAVLNGYEGVLEAKVYPQKNSILGNLVCCDLVAPDVVEKTLRQYLNQQLQTFKIPRLINFVDSLDKTRTGKLKR